METKREDLEARVKLADLEAFIELLLHDARNNGDTATIKIERVDSKAHWVPPQFELRVNGFYYGGGFLGKKNAKAFLENQKQDGQLRHSLCQWADSLKTGDIPFWFPEKIESDTGDPSNLSEKGKREFSNLISGMLSFTRKAK